MCQTWLTKTTLPYARGTGFAFAFTALPHELLPCQEKIHDLNSCWTLDRQRLLLKPFLLYAVTLFCFKRFFRIVFCIMFSMRFLPLGIIPVLTNIYINWNYWYSKYLVVGIGSIAISQSCLQISLATHFCNPVQSRNHTSWLF